MILSSRRRSAADCSAAPLDTKSRKAGFAGYGRYGKGRRTDGTLHAAGSRPPPADATTRTPLAMGSTRKRRP